MMVYWANKIPVITTYAWLALCPHPIPSMPVWSMKVEKTKLPDWWVGALAKIAMTTAVVPMACHKIDTLFKYLRMWTPKVFISPDQKLSFERHIYTRCVHTLAHKNSGIDADRGPWSWHEICAKSTDRWQESSASKAMHKPEIGW